LRANDIVAASQTASSSLISVTNDGKDQLNSRVLRKVAGR
jgi:hypothetical protein